MRELRELRERTVDVMLGRLLKPLADEDVEMEILCDDHVVVAVGTKHPLAARKTLALADLMDEPWILFPATNVTSGYVADMFRTVRAEEQNLEPLVTRFVEQARTVARSMRLGAQRRRD